MSPSEPRGFAAHDVPILLLRRRWSLGYLHEIRWMQPFSEGGAHNGGVELQIAGGSADVIVQRQVEQ